MHGALQYITLQIFHDLQGIRVLKAMAASEEEGQVVGEEQLGAWCEVSGDEAEEEELAAGEEHERDGEVSAEATEEEYSTASSASMASAPSVQEEEEEGQHLEQTR